MSAAPSILAIIPARGGSKGIPRKNARPLAGKPLLHYSCDCAIGSRRITRTVVSTDCQRLACLAREAGVEVPFLRPAQFANDDSPTQDVVTHTLSWLRTRECWEPDVAVLLQPTAPLRQAADVDAALDQLLLSGGDSVVSVSRVDAHYHPAWQFTIADGQLQRCVGGPISGVPPRRQLLHPTFVRNGAIYAFHAPTIREQGSFYGRKCLAYEMPPERSINLDSLADWRAAEAYLRNAKRASQAA